MPKITREDLLRKDKIILQDEKSKRIEKIVYHQNVEFGIDSLGASGDSSHVKEVKFFNGLSGSLTQLSDGRSYIVAGAGVTITSGSNDQIVIESSAGSGTGDIQGVTAGVGLSGGGTSGTVTLNLDINGISTALDDSSFDDDDFFAVHDTTAGDIKKIKFQHMMEYAAGGTNKGLSADVAGRLSIDINALSAQDINVGEDFIAFSDEGTSGDPTRKESIVDFMTAVAGTGIAASVGVLSVDLNGVAVADVNVANDSIAIIDADASNATKKESIVDFVAGIAGSGLSAASGQLSVSSLTVTQGGTGQTSFADKSVIITQDSGPDTLSAATMSTNGQLLIGGTSGPAVATLTEGTNISITNSDGAITIAAAGVAPGAAGSDTHVQFNDGGSALGTDSTFTFNKTTNSLSVPRITGSLTTLTDGTPFLRGTGATVITTASNGSVIISSTNTQYAAGDGIALNGGTLFEADLKTNGGLQFDLTQLAINDSIVATISGSKFSGGTIHEGGITGSIFILTDGTPYLRGGTNVRIQSQSNGSVIISSTDTNTEYTAGNGLLLNSTQFLINDSIVATISGSTFTGATKHNEGLSGSLTQLVDGTSYLRAGANIVITSASNGGVTIAAATGGDLGTITGVTAGTGIIGGGSSGIVTLAINDSIVATLTGSQFSGNVGVTGSIESTSFLSGSIVKAPALSGSLTKLHNGTSYLVAGTNVTIVSGTSGQVTISAPNASPAGSNTQIQFNNNGSFGASADLTWDGTDFTVNGNVNFAEYIYHAGDTDTFIQFADDSIGISAGGEQLITISESPTFVKIGDGGDVDFQVRTLNDDNTLYVKGDTDRIGIGTNSPSSIVHIKESAPTLTLQRENNSNASTINFVGQNGNTANSIIHDSATNDLVFKTFNGSTTEEIMRIGDHYGVDNRQIILLSGSCMHAGAMQPRQSADIAFFVSGSVGSRGSSVKGAAVFGGDTFISGTLASLAGISGSLTQLVDGSSYLVAGSNVTITSASNGSITISSTGGGGGGSISVVSGSTSIGTVSTIAASDGFILNDEGGGRAGLTSSIGLAEDGTYTDGLFTDFTPQTRLGIAIDRFNEILKLLAPSPAPDLDDIDVNVDGTDAYLSFGASNDLESEGTPYYSVGTGAGLSAVDVNGLYQTATSGNNLRAAIFNGTTDIVGDLNEDVSADGSNFPANSFGNADQGELRLEINGKVIHTVDLTSFTGTGSPGSGTGITNSSGSCFTNFSTAADGTLDNGTAFPNFKHRTGRYKVIASDQRQGWNYARVLHVHSTTTTTNFVEWVNDSDANALAASNNSLTFTGAGSLHLSGIEYFTNGTAQYLVKVDNSYRNIYDVNNITFTTSTGGSLNTSTSFSISSQTKPTINTGAGEDHTKILHLTGSSSVTATQMLSGSITAGVSVSHPFKTNLSNAGQASDEGILIYNRSNSSTNTVETFRRENYRIVSGAYTTQASLTTAGNVWDSTVHMTASNGGHTNGLQFFNQRLYSPTNTLNSGNFSTFSNGPSENPDYSGLSGQRTFYRWFRNTTGSTQYDFSIAINGSSTTIVSAATALNSGRIRVFVKFPSDGTRETGWLDLATEFVLDSYSDNQGAHTANGGLSFDSSLNATNYVTLGTVGVGNNEYIGLRIEADESWTGYVSQITVSFGAGTGTITAIPDLDDIDCNDDGTDCNLSFGASKPITGYENSSTAAGFIAVALNGLYQTATSGNNLRQSVFQLDRIVEGDLNEDVSAVSPDFVANSFSDANSGSLALEVNGNTVHTVTLTGAYNLVGAGEPGSGTGTALNGNGSGFFDLSVWRPAEFDNEIPYYLEIYRTGKFRVHTADQRNGWNYARVVHSGSWGARATNYVEWINDNNSDALGSAGVGITAFGDDTFAYSSGVKFFTSPTGSIVSRISNIYKNVYSDSSSALSFINLTNATGTNIIQSGSGLSSTKSTSSSTDSLQTLNATTDSQNELLHVSGTLSFSQSKSLPGNFTTDYNCSGGMRFLHPFKTQHDLSTQTATNLLVWTPSNTSTVNYNEYFTDETYRIVAGTYSTQSSVTAGSNDWNSQYSINDPGSYAAYATGLLVYDTYIMSPKKGGNAGDFRNHTETGLAASMEGPSGNPNYSSLTNATRDYYRGFLNPTSNDLARITIVLYGDATIVGKSSSLGANKNVYVELKIPAKTGFLDLGTASAGSGNISDGDGCLFGDPDSTIDSGGATNVCTFNGATVDGTSSGAEYFVIKISADEDWTGYIDRIQVTWSG